ncbi:unnamed protein product [Timema podura]|uniref:Mediator of RNA polymerase II transcription subunit 31 n=1 Tax=Timema podura TaxID=61482 RepID=A0ABN7NIG0_TIMPD|nr:unnamed protein product [Timema podura]
MLSMATKSGPDRPETEDQQRLRFQVELEFVQCLANPNYLNFLAQRGYFKDQAFINYLKYLLYWKEPDYASTNTLGEKWSIHSVQDLLTINKYFCGNITPEGGQGYCRLKLNYMPIKIMVAQPMDKASHTNLHDVF